MPFQKGHKLAKGGKRKGAGAPKLEVRELAGVYTEEALQRLAFWMRSDNAKASVSASVALLDRGHGKAPQALDVVMTKSKEDIEAENKRFERLYGYIGGLVK